MIRFLSICLIGCLYFLPVKAQLAAYSNFQNQFIVWDDGMLKKIDHLIPKSVSIGRNNIAFIDNAMNFKVYVKGEGVTKINSGFTNRFQVSDNIVSYQNGSNLLVWDRGESHLLSKNSSIFYTGDSIVVFFDQVRNQFNAYYNHQIYPIESFLAGSLATNLFVDISDDKRAVVSSSADIASGQLPALKVSDNIAAYVNFANQFKVFYRGQIQQVEEYLVKSFDVGRNTVAYVDANEQFKLMHNGSVQVLDNIKPENYSVGDDIVAYVGNDYYFKIFYNDSVYNIGYFDPEYYVKDNLVVFRDQANYFCVFYKGKVYKLETFFPTDFVISYNSIAFINQARVLKMFTEGKTYEVSAAELSDWNMQYDVLTYKFGANMYKIFYKGETY